MQKKWKRNEIKKRRKEEEKKKVIIPTSALSPSGQAIRSYSRLVMRSSLVHLVEEAWYHIFSNQNQFLFCSILLLLLQSQFASSTVEIDGTSKVFFSPSLPPLSPLSLIWYVRTWRAREVSDDLLADRSIDQKKNSCHVFQFLAHLLSLRGTVQQAAITNDTI